jgi:hypothetical protein
MPAALGSRLPGSPSGHDTPRAVRRGGTFCRLGRPPPTVRDHSASRWWGVATARRRGAAPGAARSAGSPSGHDMPRVVRRGGAFCRLGRPPPTVRDHSASCRRRVATVRRRGAAPGAARSAGSPSGHDTPRVVRRGGAFCRLGRPQPTVRDHSASRWRGVPTARRRRVAPDAARRAGSPSGHDMPRVVRRGGAFCRLGRPQPTVRDHSASRWRGVPTARRRQWARPQTDGRPGASWHRASRPSGTRV